MSDARVSDRCRIQWTPSMDTILETGWRAGEPMALIGQRLGYLSPGAVGRRARHLGLGLHPLQSRVRAAAEARRATSPPKPKPEPVRKPAPVSKPAAKPHVAIRWSGPSAATLRGSTRYATHLEDAKRTAPVQTPSDGPRLCGWPLACDGPGVWAVAVDKSRWCERHGKALRK